MSTSRKGSGLTLQALIEAAILKGADTVDLEYVREGLEVTYMSGNIGLGEIVHDRESIETIIGELVTRAKLENKSRGVFKQIHAGREYEVRAEQYESFGESAFRLVLKKPKQHG